MVRIGIVFVVAGLGALWYQTVRSIDEGHWIGVSIWDVIEAAGSGRPSSGWSAFDQTLFELLRLPPTLTLTAVGLAMIVFAWLRGHRTLRLGEKAIDQMQKEAQERRVRLEEDSNRLKRDRRLHRIRHKVA
ncbi:MAG: hypothetical protein HZC25_15560 [Rhodospirillales bacterium]|nr:hypothetical protein [Rhodospirillales bacterium]